MKLRGAKYLKSAGRRLRSRFVNGALILGYHRVAEEQRDFFSLSVSPDNFAEQLSVIRDLALPIRLAHLAKELRNGTIPKRAVVVTLDDGYADNLYNAKPLLEQYEIPATVFVVSGYLGEEFWWDELERLVLDDGNLPPGETLHFKSVPFSWTPHSDSEHEQREELLLSLYRALRPLSQAERQENMSRLREWLGIAATNHAGHRSMTSTEMEHLTEGGLIDIGSHSHTHPVMASLTHEQQRFEICQSKNRLEEITGRSVSGFSYPNGSASQTTSDIVRDAGYGFACASDEDVVWRGSNLFHLPRYWVPNWNGDQFARWLARWLKA